MTTVAVWECKSGSLAEGRGSLAEGRGSLASLIS